MENLNYNGAVRYGDKVWLQVGRHELLGSNSSSIVTNNKAADRADLYFGRPVSINCRRENLEAAKYRGCWVFINKHAPLASMGQEIQHLDDVVLEQEFAYLVSPSYNQVDLRQVSSFPIFTFDNSEEAVIDRATNW